MPSAGRSAAGKAPMHPRPPAPAPAPAAAPVVMGAPLAPCAKAASAQTQTTVPCGWNAVAAWNEDAARRDWRLALLQDHAEGLERSLHTARDAYSKAALAEQQRETDLHARHAHELEDLRVKLSESAAEQARLRACVEPHYRAMQHKQLQVQQLTATVASLQHQVASLQQTMQQMAHQHQRQQQALWHSGRA